MQQSPVLASSSFGNILPAASFLPFVWDVVRYYHLEKRNFRRIHCMTLNDRLNNIFKVYDISHYPPNKNKYYMFIKKSPDPSGTISY